MKRKHKLFRVIAIVLAMLMPVSTALTFMASGEGSTDSGTADNTTITEKYAKPDLNALIGIGGEPEELSVSAGATYQEKAWYEYVSYSENAVCSYRLNDDYRILFYDPYTYTNSMIMDVQFDAATTDFDTMSSYTVSNTTSKTINTCTESTYTDSSATQTSGLDQYHVDVQNGGKATTTYNHDTTVTTKGTVKEDTKYTYKSIEYLTESLTTTVGTETGATLGATGAGTTVSASLQESVQINNNVAIVQDGQTHTTDYGSGYKTTTTNSGKSTVEDNTNSVTDGWEQLAARVTKTTGSSSSTSTSWSETESVTVSKTYVATHFASDGVTPLPWAIVHYSVQMPMKCCLQVKYSGEWVTLSTVYCLLTTVKGTCRAWRQNGQVYYEDWGNGEPVVENDFWSQFLTVDRLIQLYNGTEDQKKLYPTGGNH